MENLENIIKKVEWHDRVYNRDLKDCIRVKKATLITVKLTIQIIRIVWRLIMRNLSRICIYKELDVLESI